MECVAFHFLNNYVGRQIMEPQTVKEWFGGSVGLSIQDLDQKMILVVMLFPFRGAYIFGQILYTVKSPTAHPKDFQRIWP